MRCIVHSLVTLFVFSSAAFPDQSIKICENYRDRFTHSTTVLKKTKLVHEQWNIDVDERTPEQIASFGKDTEEHEGILNDPLYLLLLAHSYALNGDDLFAMGLLEKASFLLAAAPLCEGAVIGFHITSLRVKLVDQLYEGKVSAIDGMKLPISGLGSPDIPLLPEDFEASTCWLSESIDPIGVNNVSPIACR